MEAQSTLNHSIPPDLNGHYRFGYGGAIASEHITSQQRSNYSGRKKSKVRLNDQLLPKPTDINMAEKMIKIGIPKEHPYSSHISQFAMFPSFCSPDDPETGVRAASQPFLNPLIPNSAPDVTLLSKTIGGPYRHELLDSPMKTRKKAVMWAGEHSFLDHSKPLMGENQVFYPTPPKKVLPNPKLREWDLTLCERTSNILKNLERTHWITSYQLDYTGSGPANPLKIDDFKEKISDLTGMTSHTAQLRERSFPVFVPSKPRKGCRRRQGSCVGRSTCSPTAADPLNQATTSDTTNQHRPQEITANHNEAPDPNQKGHSQSKYSSGSTEAQSSGLSQGVLHKQQTETKSSVCEGRERENRKVQFDESLMHVSVAQSSQEANAAQIADIEKLLDSHKRPLSQGETEVREKSPIELCVKDEPSSKKEYFKAGRRVSSLGQSAVAKDMSGIESHAELSSRASQQDTLQTGRELLSNPCILPRPSVLPGIRPVDRVGAVGREEAALSLLDLQNSFSKSNVNRIFNSSITRPAVNLRDNVVTGKKHDFYGINCYYLHG
ncbi:sperm-associated microtubule inner protein 4 [Pempheris klunzingeri]|uniref:sperm-associated microtubule inner protein 4 n=1 Tax=Pempheris klunzingeri TaxID=3127111 RepID=UPI00397F9606